MMECKKEYAGTLYIDAGFLGGQVRYDGTPVYNAQYPNAWATTYAPVALGDIVSCDELTAYSDKVRIRQYYTYGNMTSNRDGGAKITIKEQGVGYIRLMVIDEVSEQQIPKEMTVTHADGTVDTYKIIDRR